MWSFFHSVTSVSCRRMKCQRRNHECDTVSEQRQPMSFMMNYFTFYLLFHLYLPCAAQGSEGLSTPQNFSTSADSASWSENLAPPQIPATDKQLGNTSALSETENFTSMSIGSLHHQPGADTPSVFLEPGLSSQSMIQETSDRSETVSSVRDTGMYGNTDHWLGPEETTEQSTHMAWMPVESVSPAMLQPVAGCVVAERTVGTERFVNITKEHGNITALTSDEVAQCEGEISVTAGYGIDAFFDTLVMEPESDCQLQVFFCKKKISKCEVEVFGYTMEDDSSSSQDFFQFQDHHMHVDVSAQHCSNFHLQLHYRAVPLSSFHSLPVVNTSSTSGYITTPGYEDGKNYLADMNTTVQLSIAEDQVILLSFPHFHLENHTVCRYDSLKLYTVNSSGNFLYKTLCGQQDLPLMVFNDNVVISFVSDSIIHRSGFKMLFTILPKSNAPRIVHDDLLDCSVAHYEQFAPHVNCNLAVECAGKEDERQCPYSSQECQPGEIDAGETCYTYTRLQKELSWYDAYSQCLNMNQTLVNPGSPLAWSNFMRVMSYGRKTSVVYTGLRTSQTPANGVPALYRDMWQWSDQVIGLYVHLDITTRSVPVCSRLLRESNSTNLQTVSCVQPTDARYVCERWKTTSSLAKDKVATPSLGGNYTWTKNVTLVTCPPGHLVRDYLACDLQSQCREEHYESSCALPATGGRGRVAVPLFQCDHITQSVHYTLVCDARLDCSDGSDESWCVTGQCPEDSCRTGQCISRDQRCDGMQHCVDASDENCPQVIHTNPVPVPPPALVTLDGKGGYSLLSMEEGDPCPQTHFWCGPGYCLPLYVRCNGVDDCPGRQDETGCEDYGCPDFYRCRASKVCLHPEHVCDGVYHCPQKDDELLCDLACPAECHCQGLAFICPADFPVADFPTVRFVDASGSHMKPSDFVHNFYLVHLRLSKCRLKSMQSLALPNLRTLDVSHNFLTFVELDTFLSFVNLKVLDLANNPLTKLIAGDPSLVHPRLKTLSLSSTLLTALNSTVFRHFPDMKNLNLSSTPLSTITEEGFSGMAEVEILDLRRSRLTRYPSDLLKDLADLKLLYADDFKLCCRETLPAGFDLENCHAPSDDIASCEDLLRSDVYRVFLWLFALLAVLGNCGSFFARFYLQSESFHSSFNVLVTNLSVADFVMGVYLTIIGVADRVYRGQYIWYVDTWRNSVTCQIAGFLSLLSSEVSAFFICLITLDRFLVLRFPFSRLHFCKKSAMAASLVAWLIGLALAAVPLLPMTSDWNFYSQTGICIPLPFARRTKFAGYSYSFGVMMVLNLVLFVLIAVGQVFIYCAVRAQSSAARAKKKASRDAAIARRLTTIVLSDFLCWFPIGLLGVMSSLGTSIPVDVKVGVAIFVLPFNSALNPFLYTFNIVMEKRRKAAEARLLARIESRHLTELSRIDGRLPAQMPITKETALNQIEGWLGVRVLTMSDLAARFDMMPKMNDTEASPPPPSATSAINIVL